MKKPLERWDYQDGQPWGNGTPVAAVSMFLSACDDIETSQEYTVQDTFKYGFAERYKLENAIAQPTTGTFSVQQRKFNVQLVFNVSYNNKTSSPDHNPGLPRCGCNWSNEESRPPCTIPAVWPPVIS